MVQSDSNLHWLWAETSYTVSAYPWGLLINCFCSFFSSTTFSYTCVFVFFQLPIVEYEIIFLSREIDAVDSISLLPQGLLGSSLQLSAIWCEYVLFLDLLAFVADQQNLAAHFDVLLYSEIWSFHLIFTIFSNFTANFLILNAKHMLHYMIFQLFLCIYTMQHFMYSILELHLFCRSLPNPLTIQRTGRSRRSIVWKLSQTQPDLGESTWIGHNAEFSLKVSVLT